MLLTSKGKLRCVQISKPWMSKFRSIIILQEFGQAHLRPSSPRGRRQPFKLDHQWSVYQQSISNGHWITTNGKTNIFCMFIRSRCAIFYIDHEHPSILLEGFIFFIYRIIYVCSPNFETKCSASILMHSRCRVSAMLIASHKPKTLLESILIQFFLQTFFGKSFEHLHLCSQFCPVKI